MINRYRLLNARSTEFGCMELYVEDAANENTRYHLMVAPHMVTEMLNALDFYSNEDNYYSSHPSIPTNVEEDEGKIARASLRKEGTKL